MYLLTHHGSEEQQQTYLPKMVTGEWSGTMNLTEPQAGSDVGAVTTKAVPADDGTYRITGQKIYITFGEHELTENIIHLVLARLPDAPPGTKGISLFIVPKFLVNDDGSLGERNDVSVVSLEHKLGIHASPTCVMAYGEDGEGAVGYLVGEPQHRHARHVHDDERRPARGRHPGTGHRRARLPAGARLRARAPAGPRADQRARASSRRSSSTPTSGGCC